ncbi:GntR family transcriptional regulator [Rhodobacteraceae bacterium CCMM004]|nr:GntR family transcriptional regulator [Rhodobacteraceae bacterium CCMM004]
MPEPSTAPLYLQISELLLRRIADGQLLEGERLPPEREMAATHGISVGTLRKALADLADKGLLERRQGSGNYIRGVRAVGGLYGFFRVELDDGPGLPSSEVLSTATLAKPGDAPAFGPADTAHRIRRLRRLDGRPALLEEIWLDGSWGAPEPGDLDAALYRTYRERLGLRIVRVEDRVGVGAVPEWGARALDLPAGRAVGLVTRVAWAHTGARAEYSLSWFNSDICRYVSRLN